MKKFLEELAIRAITEFPDTWQNHLFVFPGRRAGLFFNMYVASVVGKTTWAPQSMGFDSFLSHLDGQKPIGNLELLFEAYEIYKDLEGQDAEPFDKFMFWAPKALADFNEVDNYMLDANRLFKDLRDFKEIEEWSFGEDELSSSQVQYAEFWFMLGELFQAYKTHLDKKNLTSTGTQKRRLAESIDSWSADLPWEKIWFVGFSAVSTAEQQILFGLEKINKANLIWDVDSYYLNDANNEAGLFFRALPNFETLKKNSPNSFSSTPKNIQSISAATPVTMVKAAMTELQGLGEEELRNTAVVLADERLLEVVLSSLPDNIKSVNITMGYPVDKLPLVSFVKHVFAYWQNVRVEVIYHQEFFSLLQNPVLVEVIPDLGAWLQEFEAKVKEDNLAFFSKKDIPNVKDRKASVLLENIFLEPPKTADSAIEKIYTILTLFHSADQVETGSNLSNSVFKLAEILKVVKEYQLAYATINSLSVLKKIFEKLVSREALDFYGEPLKGLQIMGLLESRALDFDRILLIGVNEDVLPKARQENSFIPFEIKQIFGLPNFRHKDAIFAYYFYRLLQRSSNISLYYNTLSNNLGGGEKSRYLMQLEYELPMRNPLAVLNHKIAMFPSGSGKIPIVVQKDELLLTKTKSILQSGISPSAINKYLGCPLDFYYRYLLGMSEPNVVEENMESSSFGTVVHVALENLYLDAVKSGEKLTREYLVNAQLLVEGEVEKTMRKEFSQQVDLGPNYLMRKGIVEYVKRLLDLDKKTLEGGSLYINGLELDLRESCVVNYNNEPFELKLRGSADRIDKLNGMERVVDYKTGFVSANELILDSTDLDKVLNGKSSKALQLLIYAYTYLKKEGNSGKTIKAGIISFRNLSKGFLPLVLDGDEVLNSSIFEKVERIMEVIVNHMLNQTEPYEHDPKGRFCNYCN